MEPVSPKGIESMAAIMAALNGAVDGGAEPNPLKSEKVGDDAHMGSILEAFRSATDDLVETSKTNSTVRTALATERVEGGVRVGSWKIDIREEGYGKSYDVSHSMTGEPIASDLRLYEAALALVNALNEGETFTSSTVKIILELERDYSRALSDAISFSTRMKVTEGVQHDIAEARYSEAKRKALSAKKTISRLND